jgi:hypothetical protein
MKLETVIAVAEKQAQALQGVPDALPFAWDTLTVAPYGRLTEFFPEGLIARARNGCGKIAEWQAPGPIFLFEGLHQGTHTTNWVFTLRDGQFRPFAHPHVSLEGNLCIGSAPDPLTALMSLNPNSVAGLRIEYTYDKGGPETPCKNCGYCGGCEAHDKAHLANKHLHHKNHLRGGTACGKCRTCGDCQCPVCSCVHCQNLTADTTITHCPQCVVCTECRMCTYHQGHAGDCIGLHYTCLSSVNNVPTRCPCGHHPCGQCCDCGQGHVQRVYEANSNSYSINTHARCQDCGESDSCSCRMNICNDCDRGECCGCRCDDDDY